VRTHAVNPSLYKKLPYATSKPHIDSGRVRPLGVSTARRLSGVDIPTIAETGLPG
jgi:tripartite-type tricarboxylate transporter receptor subunit TctC